MEQLEKEMIEASAIRRKKKKPSNRLHFLMETSKRMLNISLNPSNNKPAE